jgi:hypothetical protein
MAINTEGTKKIMRTLAYTLAISLLAGPAFAASNSNFAAGNTAQLDAVPPYPASGIIPAELEHQYVFRDLSTGNLILSYPTDLIANGVAPSGTIEGGRVKQVIVLANRVDPFFDVTVTRSSSGLLYSYTVRNTSRAQQAIATWRIEGRSASSVFTGDARTLSALDAGSAATTQVPTTWTAAEPGTALHWVARSTSNGIPPGSSLSGFSIQSSLRPGFFRAFASSSAMNPLQVPDAPAAVEQQLKNVEPFALEQAALTIGPKFSSGTPDAAIAADFASGIQVLIKHGYLSAGSPLVQELRTKLQAYLGFSGSLPETPAEELPRLTLQLQNKPTTDLERVIVGAIQAGLETN